MNWFEPIDAYCERLAPGLLAEPLNALSNASFFASALILFLQWRRSEALNLPALILIANVVAVGIGSLLFHTFANRWSALADDLPIAAFIHLGLLLALRAYLALSWPMAAAITIGFFFASPFIGNFARAYVGSSAFYIPAALAIFAVALASIHRAPAVTRNLAAAGLVLLVSIAFRAADQPFCESWPSGTHMFWHLLNGVVLYLLVRVYMRFTSAPEVR